jgi:hypothetical protein
MIRDREKQQQEQLRDEARAAKESVPEAPESGEVVQDIFTLDNIFRRILASADSELDKKTQLLFWSGLAAGLTLGLTFLSRLNAAPLGPARTVKGNKNLGRQKSGSSRTRPKTRPSAMTSTNENLIMSRVAGTVR